MATNNVFSYTEGLAEFWTLSVTTDSGVPVLSISKQPAITLTGTGDFVKSEVLGTYTVSGIPAGGVGLEGKEASIATDGTWKLNVTGGTVSTPQNTLVYMVESTGALTLTVGSAPVNATYGKVNYPKGGIRVAGVLPVKIGKF